MAVQWCTGSEPRALFVFVGPHSVIRLRNALRPSSFPPPYPPPPSDLPLHHSPPIRPFASRYPPLALFRPHHQGPSSTGGSNGCGGICQAVTHPHGRILGYVFARSLPLAFHLCHILSLSFFLSFFSSVPASPYYYLSRYTDLHSSVHSSVHIRPTST